MFITQEERACNNAEPQASKISISGNIVPHNWYHNLLRPCGKSDTTAIAILSELVFLHRYNGATEFQLNFGYFARKFNFGLSQVKDAVIRLEKLSLLKRDLRTVVVCGRPFVNEMFLILNISNVLKLNPNNKTSDQNNFNDSSECEVKKFLLADRKEYTNSPEISSDNIDKRENNKKSRSKRSNFNSNNSLGKEHGSTNRRFSFASFYPLVQSDINNLQNLCGREFSSNAINEILLSLSRKLPNHDFPHKKAFINYMAKALSYEMRDAVRISNESFKIKANVTSIDTSLKQQEAFLSRIEESRDTSREAQLNRKLAGVLAPDIAYKFLSSASFPKETSSSKSETFTICLQENIEIKSIEHRLILEQVRSVYGDHINYLNFDIERSIKHIKQSNVKENQLLTKASTTFQGVWGKIRQSLINYYGYSGASLDNAWFSKLTAEEDENSKSLSLKAPSTFIRDWIQRNYLQLINTICLKENYQLKGVFA